MKIVLGGGALLHRVGWTKTDTFDRIRMATIALSRTCSAIDLFQLFLMGTLKSSTKDHLSQ